MAGRRSGVGGDEGGGEVVDGAGVVSEVWTEEEFEQGKHRERLEAAGKTIQSRVVKTKQGKETIFWVVSERVGDSAAPSQETVSSLASASSSGGSSSGKDGGEGECEGTEKKNKAEASTGDGIGTPSTPTTPVTPASSIARRRRAPLHSTPTPGPASSLSRKRPKLGRETEELRKLKQERSALKEKLRKLELVRTYRSKHDTADLDDLIPKWRGVCQEVLQDLADSKPDVTLKQLIDHFSIPPELINFNTDEEEFED